MNELIYKYRTNQKFNLTVRFTFSLFINSSYGVLKLLYALFFNSFWHGLLGFYYLFIAIIRSLLLYALKQNKTVHYASNVLIALNMLLIIIISQIIIVGHTYTYPGYMIYGIALFVFYRVVMGIYNLFKSKNASYIIRSCRYIDIIVASVSIFNLQVALLERFNPTNPLGPLMNALTGVLVCIIIFGLTLKIKKTNV